MYMTQNLCSLPDFHKFISSALLMLLMALQLMHVDQKTSYNTSTISVIHYDIEGSVVTVGPHWQDWHLTTSCHLSPLLGLDSYKRQIIWICPNVILVVE